MNMVHTIYAKYRMLHECSCIIGFIKQIEEKRSNERLYIAIYRSFGNEFNKFTCSTFALLADFISLPS